MYSKESNMSKTVTLRLDDNIYKMFKNYAADDNRPLSNFIETATLKYIEDIEYVDDFEMEEIRNNKELKQSLKRAFKDIKNKKGRFVA